VEACALTPFSEARTSKHPREQSWGLLPACACDAGIRLTA
jgi:hypothetical protein